MPNRMAGADATGRAKPTESLGYIGWTVLGFPHPVNEVAARVVAAGVVVLSVAAIATGWRWLLVVLLYGFIARVLTGPRLSPLGQLATRVIAPRLPVEPRYVAGPPKRFAQGMGLTFSLTAVLLAFVFDAPTAAWIVTGVLAAAAFLESAFGLCLGCRTFAVLMRVGLVPEETCERCANIGAAPASP
jgi:hypothetical protein